MYFDRRSEIMSKLHKRIKAHQYMTLEEKENCQCDMCKGLGIKIKHKITPFVQQKDLHEQKQKIVNEIQNVNKNI